MIALFRVILGCIVALGTCIGASVALWVHGGAESLAVLIIGLAVSALLMPDA